MTPWTQWTSWHMQKNASKVRLVHHHVQPVFPSISEFFIWGVVAVTSCLVPMNEHPHGPHVRCAMEVLYLGSEIIWEDSLQSKTTHVYQEIICPSSISRQHMSIFAKAYIWRKLVVSPWKIVKNWLYPSSHISTYITYINFSVISTYTPWEIVVSNYRNHVYPSGQKKPPSKKHLCRNFGSLGSGGVARDLTRQEVRTRWCPLSIAKLVNITPITMVYRWYIYI